MPVAHLGLTVSHIPSATSFYLATLAPLGYRYIGQSGDSVGLGVDKADFFLTQEPRGRVVSPAHIAFTADSRLDVRNCYAAALKSGAYPSGSPSYRDSDYTVFNAAVEDLDGNVVEFIHNEAAPAPAADQEPAANEHSRVLSWRESVAESGVHDDAASQGTRSSRRKSRADTADESASVTSKSTRSRSAAPASDSGRSRNSDFASKAFFGTLIGATAGAALAWAVLKTEGSNAGDEAQFSASTYPRSRRHSIDGMSTRPPPSRRSQTDRRYPPSSLARTRPAIDAQAYYEDVEDEGSRVTRSRYTSSRWAPLPQRSLTWDAIEYRPASISARRSEDGSRHSQRFLEAPPRVSATTAPPSAVTPLSAVALPSAAPPPATVVPSVPASRQATAVPSVPASRPATAVPSVTASRPPPSRTGTTASRHSTVRSLQTDDVELKRRDSGVSMTSSHRSRHSRSSRHSAAPSRAESQRSGSSTIRPSHRTSASHASAAAVPLPSSRATSHASAPAVPLPPSRTASHAASEAPSTSRVESYVTATQNQQAAFPPVEEAGAEQAVFEDAIAAEDSDGLGDTRTVVPEDSISCVDFSAPRPPIHRSSTTSAVSARMKSKPSSQYYAGSRKSSAAGSDRTVLRSSSRREGGGGSRRSAVTLPVRAREEVYESRKVAGSYA